MEVPIDLAHNLRVAAWQLLVREGSHRDAGLHEPTEQLFLPVATV
jgi:hypothetical protein